MIRQALPVDVAARAGQAVTLETVRESLGQAASMETEVLVEDAAAIVRGSNRSMVSLVIRLATLDAREVPLAQACPSLGAWCQRKLGLSEDVAWNVAAVAKVGREVPRLLELLAEGEVSLSSARGVVSLLRRGFGPEVVERFAGLSVREARRLRDALVAEAEAREAAERAAQKGADERAGEAGDGSQGGREEVPLLAFGAGASGDGAGSARETERTGAEGADERGAEEPRQAGGEPGVSAGGSGAGGATKGVQRRPKAVLRKEGDGTRLSAVLPASVMEDLEACRALLGHAVPDGDVVEVLARGLKLLRKELERRRFGAPRRSRKGRGPKGEPQGQVRREGRGEEDVRAEAPGGSEDAAGAKGDATAEAARPQEGPYRYGAERPGRRSIPAAVRRAVYERDGGRCAYRDPETGERCGSTRRLEYDHIVPVALGGADTVENLRLLCRAHNQYEARRRFGDRARGAGRGGRGRRGGGGRPGAAAAGSRHGPVR